MTALTRLGILITLILSMLGLGSDREAQLSVTYEFRNDSVYYADDVARPEEPEPEATIYTVKRGTVIDSGRIRVTNVTDQAITIKTSDEYFSNLDYEAGRTFTISRGQTIVLTLCGLCDATETYTLTFLE